MFNRKWKNHKGRHDSHDISILETIDEGDPAKRQDSWAGIQPKSRRLWDCRKKEKDWRKRTWSMVSDVVSSL